MRPFLTEHLSFDQARMETVKINEGKDLYMKGIFIEGGVKNANQRVYPANEIARAVKNLNEQISKGYSVLGEVDHPTNLRINLDRVSHVITEMWLDDAKGCGKMKILPTPMGKIVSEMLNAGVKLGVSSRGSGDVNESSGTVSNFDIVTVDIVAQPSAPSAYPTAVYEGLMNMKGGHRVLEMAKDLNGNTQVQKYLAKEVARLIDELKIR
jgi:Prohead core protein serine protease